MPSLVLTGLRWGRYSRLQAPAAGPGLLREKSRWWAEPGGAPRACKSRAGWSSGTDICSYGASSLLAGHGPGPACILPPDSVPGRPRRAAEPQDRRTPKPVSQRSAGAEGRAGRCEHLQYGQQQPLLLPRYQNPRCSVSGMVASGGGTEWDRVAVEKERDRGQARELMARYQTALRQP